MKPVCTVIMDEKDFTSPPELEEGDYFVKLAAWDDPHLVIHFGEQSHVLIPRKLVEILQKEIVLGSKKLEAIGGLMYETE